METADAGRVEWGNACVTNRACRFGAVKAQEVVLRLGGPAPFFSQ